MTAFPTSSPTSTTSVWNTPAGSAPGDTAPSAPIRHARVHCLLVARRGVTAGMNVNVWDVIEHLQALVLRARGSTRNACATPTWPWTSWPRPSHLRHMHRAARLFARPAVSAGRRAHALTPRPTTTGAPRSRPRRSARSRRAVPHRRATGPGADPGRPHRSRLRAARMQQLVRRHRRAVQALGLSRPRPSRRPRGARGGQLRRPGLSARRAGKGEPLHAISTPGPRCAASLGSRPVGAAHAGPDGARRRSSCVPRARLPARRDRPPASAAPSARPVARHRADDDAGRPRGDDRGGRRGAAAGRAMARAAGSHPYTEGGREVEVLADGEGQLLNAASRIPACSPSRLPHWPGHGHRPGRRHAAQGHRRHPPAAATIPRRESDARPRRLSRGLGAAPSRGAT